MDKLYKIIKHPLTLDLEIITFSVIQVTKRHIFLTPITDGPDKTMRIEKSQVGSEYFETGEAAFKYRLAAIENALSKLDTRMKLVQSELDEILALQAKILDAVRHD